MSIEDFLTENITKWACLSHDTHELKRMIGSLTEYLDSQIKQIEPRGQRGYDDENERDKN